MTYQELENAMKNPNSAGYKKYLEIRKKNLHKMNPIPFCKMKND
jgi:NAD+ synthase